MSIRRWNDAETAIAVYFASRNAGHEACAKIIFHKTRGVNLESRTSLSVRNKLHGIRMTGDLWRSQTGWNLEAVDDYLISLNVYDLKELISAGEAELAMIPEANHDVFRTTTLYPSKIFEQDDPLLHGP